MSLMNTESNLSSGQPTVAPMTAPGRSTSLDIAREIQELHQSPEWQHGIARKVLIRYPDFQITLRVMKADARIPIHHNAGRISVQTVEGLLRMHADGKVFDLAPGKMLVLDREVIHDVEAVEESAFLLTAALPPSRH